MLSTPAALSGPVELAPGFAYPAYRLLVIAAGLVVAILLYLLVAKTRIGMRVRAGASNREMALAMGVDVRALFTLVFAIGAALCALAGALLGPDPRRADRDGRERPDSRLRGDRHRWHRFDPRCVGRCPAGRHGRHRRPCVRTDAAAQLAAACSRVRRRPGAGVDRHLCADGRDPVLAAAGFVPCKSLTLANTEDTETFGSPIQAAPGVSQFRYCSVLTVFSVVQGLDMSRYRIAALLALLIAFPLAANHWDQSFYVSFASRIMIYAHRRHEPQSDPRLRRHDQLRARGLSWRGRLHRRHPDAGGRGERVDRVAGGDADPRVSLRRSSARSACARAACTSS